MGYSNPYYAYELQIYKLQDKNLALFDQLDNAKIYIKQLEKKVNQLQKDQTKWLQQLTHRIKQYLYVI